MVNFDEAAQMVALDLAALVPLVALLTFAVIGALAALVVLAALVGSCDPVPTVVPPVEFD